MIELTLTEICEHLNGELLLKGYDGAFTGASTDTRTIDERNIFFALKGENFNANQFIRDAYEKGAKLCVIDEILVKIESLPSDVSLILVNDVHKALGQLAKYYKNKLGIKVVGVTGSVGKTSTKDIICAALSEKYSVLKTLGNYNNHIGLPLTILRLDGSYDVAVLEMGMSTAGEIQYLASIAEPDIAVITNIGLSHVENLGSQEGILAAKMEITSYFNNNNKLIVNSDDKMLSTVSNADYEIIKVGTVNIPDILATDISTHSLHSSFNVIDKGISASVLLDLPGKHNIINFLLAYAVASQFDVSLADAVKGVSNIEKTSMRLDISHHNNFTIVNDCYNASPDSMKAAIDVVTQIKKEENRVIAVVGSMYELGEHTDACHTDVGEYINSHAVDLVFTTGIYTENYKKVLNEKCLTYSDKDSMISAIKSEIRANDIILIKASRGARFEDVYKSLVTN